MHNNLNMNALHEGCTQCCLASGESQNSYYRRQRIPVVSPMKFWVSFLFLASAFALSHAGKIFLLGQNGKEVTLVEQGISRLTVPKVRCTWLHPHSALTLMLGLGEHWHRIVQLHLGAVLRQPPCQYSCSSDVGQTWEEKKDGNRN